MGEWFGDNVGLGVMLLQALYFEQAERVWALIVICGLLGALLGGLLASLKGSTSGGESSEKTVATEAVPVLFAIAMLLIVWEAVASFGQHRNILPAPSAIASATMTSLPHIADGLY